MTTLATKKAPIKYVSKSGSRLRVFYVPSKVLHPHPLLGREGMLPDMIERETKLGNKAGSNREDHKARAAELIQEFEALQADQLAHGTKEPLKVVKSLAGWLIADGRNRWAGHTEITTCHHEDPKQAAAAKRAEARGLPCIEITEEEVPAVILSAMTRRHMTKQARALMAVKAFPEVALEAKSGRPTKSGNEYPITQPALAERIGVSLELMKDACLFWRKISLNPKTREERMNQVFAGVSFERVMQGEKGKAATKGKKRESSKVWTLMTRNANSMKGLWKDFEALDDEERKIDIVESLTDAITAAPEQVKSAIKTALEGGES